MNIKNTVLTAAALMLILAAPGHGMLIDNLDGTIIEIRNDGSELMWLKDGKTCYSPHYGYAGLMNWYEAKDWITFLNSSNYLGYNDWRLPLVLPVNGSSYNYAYSRNGSTDQGYNITSPNSELSYLYYVELGNTGTYAADGTFLGSSPINSGPFINNSYVYWTNTAGIVFNFNGGVQFSESPLVDWHDVWLVRTIVSAPEPKTIFLMSAGLILISLIGRQKSADNSLS